MIDNHKQDLLLVLEQSFSFINQARDLNGKVLVHCFKGVSRSAAIICAYLIKYFHYSFEESLSLIRTVRPIANPNPHFSLTLKKYEERILQSSNQETKEEKEQKQERKGKEE